MPKYLALLSGNLIGCAVYLLGVARTECFLQLGNALLNLVILNCENHAFSPDWWEGLEPSLKTNICEAMNKQADVLSVLNQDYLTSEITGIAPWAFESVYDSKYL